MTISALALCNSALLRVGVRGIASLTEDVPEAQIARQLYPEIRDALLSRYNWRFATRQQNLARVTSVETNRDNRFQLPTDCLAVITVIPRGLDFQVLGDQLLSQASSCRLVYLARTPEAKFPQFFATALIAQLSQAFCIPLLADIRQYQLLARLAEQAVAQAWLIDRRQGGVRILTTNLLIAARG